MSYNENTVYENGHEFTHEELAALIAQDIIDFFNHCVYRKSNSDGGRLTTQCKILQYLVLEEAHLLVYAKL